jgi:hypothetical protein
MQVLAETTYLLSLKSGQYTSNQIFNILPFCSATELQGKDLWENKESIDSCTWVMPY